MGGAPLRRWLGDRSGAVGVYVALAATVTLGIVGLAVDATRAMIVRSEAQSAADAAALAGASQLDASPTAITRATNAINTLITNRERLASSGQGPVGIASIRFLSSLPASDDTAIAAANVTTNPLAARFVEVVTAPLTHQNTFLRAVGATAPTTITTTAVAGCNQIVCRSQPLMICNPSEVSGSGTPFDLATWRGRQIRMVGQGPGVQWQPGNFGYLDPGSNGASALRDALASTAGNTVCYGPNAATSPGLANGARTALNVRFGIYEAPGFNGNAKNDPLFAPDVNVRTMPRDLSFSGSSGQFGSGVWNCQTYWTTNFGSTARPTGCADNSSALSRYSVYQYEIAHNLSQVPPLNAANQIAGRRIVYVAVINCLQNSFNGRAPSVPVNTFLRVFLTEPVADPNDVAVYGEVVDVIQVGADDAVNHDNVQLYR